MHDPTCPCCAGVPLERIDAERNRMIAEFGYMIQQVHADGRGDPGWVYTIGLAQKGMPEFLFIGDSSPTVADFLRGFAREALAGRPPAAGLHAPRTAANPYNLPVWLLEVDHRLDSHAFGAVAQLDRLGRPGRPRLMQVVMPGPGGLYPWDQGYRWADQRIDAPPVAGRA